MKFKSLLVLAVLLIAVFGVVTLTSAQTSALDCLNKGAKNDQVSCFTNLIYQLTTQLNQLKSDQLAENSSVLTPATASETTTQLNIQSQTTTNTGYVGNVINPVTATGLNLLSDIKRLKQQLNNANLSKVEIDRINSAIIKDQIELTNKAKTDLSAVLGTCHDFNSDLGYSSKGMEVRFLHAFLFIEKALDLNNTDMAGEVMYGTYGKATADAVLAFQKKYASQILTPYGLFNGTGYAGKLTRTKLNGLYGCLALKNQNSSQSLATVNYPAGGETWKIGETHNITWTYTGPTAEYVIITLYDGSTVPVSGKSTSYVILGTGTKTTASAGIFAWKVGYDDSGLRLNNLGNLQQPGSQFVVSVVIYGYNSNGTAKTYAQADSKMFAISN